MNIARTTTVRWIVAIASIGIVLLPVLTGIVFGGEPPSLIVTPSGYWLMEFDEAGIPKPPVKLTSVFVRQSVVAPAPDVPTDDPVPDDQPSIKVTEIDAGVMAEAREAAIRVNRFQDAQMLAFVYQAAADELKAGGIGVEHWGDVVVKSTDRLLKEGTQTNGVWEPWRKEMGAITARLTASVKLSAAKDVERYLRSVQMGLQASVPDEFPAIEPREGIAVTQLVEAVVKEVKAGAGGAP